MEPDLTGEMRGYVEAAVDSHRHLGRKRAIPAAAADLGITPRRVQAYRWCQVPRAWADELERARRWYRRWVQREARLVQARAELLRLRSDGLDLEERDG